MARLLRPLYAFAFAVACSTAPATAPTPPAPAPEAAPHPVAVKTLESLVRHPAGADATTSLPTVIALHGLGDRPERFQHALGDDLGVRIVALRAPLDVGQGHSWFSQRAMGADPERMAREVVARADAVAATIAQIRTTHAVEGPVLVTGFSQGGMMSFAMAALHPDAIGGAVPVAGFLPGGVFPEARTDAHRTTPVRALHGTADEVLPVAWARRAVDRMRAEGMDAELRTFDGVGHRVPPAVREAWKDALRGMMASPR